MAYINTLKHINYMLPIITNYLIINKIKYLKLIENQTF